MKHTLFLTAVMLMACNVGGTQIKGTIANASGSYVVLEQLTATKALPLDSVKAGSDGTFKLSHEVKAEGFYRIRIAPNNFVILLLGPQDREVTVNGNAIDFFRSYTVSGSAGSTLLKEVDTHFRTAFERLDSLRKVFYAKQGDPNIDAIAKGLDAEAARIDSSKRWFVEGFIKANPASLAQLSAVQALPIDHNIDLYRTVVANLKGHAGQDYVAQISARIAEQDARVLADRLTAIGSPAPALDLTTPDGRPISLADFKGKVTLIDFWASWCGPCRQENPNVVRMYQRFRDKGFEIYGVSLDKDKDKWVAAIAKDGLTWPHGSELNFWQSSFVPRYRIEGIPMTYLLDRQGNIIDKGLRGPALEKRLEELLK